MRGADEQGPLSILIGQPNPHLVPAEGGAHDLPDSAIDVGGHPVHRVARGAGGAAK